MKFPATAAVFCTELLHLINERAVCQTQRVWVTAALSGVLYCLIRWGIWALDGSRSWDLSGFVDFLISMGLAVVAGMLLLLSRQVSTPGHQSRGASVVAPLIAILKRRQRNHVHRNEGGEEQQEPARERDGNIG